MNQTLLILVTPISQNRQDPYDAFVNVRDMLSSADIVFGQLEGPLAEPSPIRHSPTFRTRPAGAIREPRSAPRSKRPAMSA